MNVVLFQIEQPEGMVKHILSDISKQSTQICMDNISTTTNRAIVCLDNSMLHVILNLNNNFKQW